MALIRGENSIFFALGLDNESLQKDADQAAVIISKSAKDITRLREEASESLKASLKEALSPNWLYSESNALLDELNKVLGAGLKFEPQEFDRLSKALESAQDEVEQTVVFWDFLNRKLKETKGSSEGLKELTSGVKLLEDHFKSMGVSAAEVMKKVNKALSSQPILPKETPLVEELRAIQEDAENYLPSFIGKAIGKLKGRLSEILGKDLKLDTQGLGSLEKLLRSSKDELQRLVALSGFFKEKLSSLGKDSPGLQKLSSEIQKIEGNLKTSGIAVEGLYNKLKKESFSLPQTKVLPYHQMAGAELSASIKGMQAYAKGMEGVKTAQASLQAQYRNTVQEMAALRKEGKEGERQYDRLKRKAAELKSALSNTYKEVNLASTGSEGIRSLLLSANGLVGVFGAAQGAAALFGYEGKSLEKTLIKLNAVLAVLHSLQSIQTALAEKNSLAFKSLAQVKSLYALATDRAVGASARLAAVMKLLGWGLIVAGIAAAVKAFEKLSEKIQEKTAAARMSLEVQREAQKNAAQESIHLKLLYEQAKNENNSRNLRIKALQELNQRYPEFLNFLKLENIGSRKAAGAIHGQTQAIMRRAKARAYEEKLVDLEKKKMEAKSKGDEAYLGWLDRGVLVLSEWMARGTIHMTKPLLKSYSNALEKNFEKEKQIFLNKRRGQIEKNRLQEGKRYGQEMAQLQGLLGKELSSGEVDFSSEKSSLSKQGENQSPFKSLIKASEEARDKVKEAVKDIEQAIVEGYDRISREKEQKRIEAMEMGFEKEKARLDQERQERERAIEKEKAARSEKIQSLEKEEKAAHNRIKEFREKGLESLATKEKALIKEIQSNKKQLIAQNQNLHFKATEAAREQYFEQLAKLQEKYKEGTLSQIQEQIAVLGQKALYAGREERKEIQEQIKILQEKASLEDRESSVILKNIQIHRMTIGVLNEQIDKNRELISQKERGLELDKKRYDQGRLSGESLRKTEKALEDLKEEGLKLQEGKEEKYAQLAGWIHFGSYQFSRTLGDLKEFLGLEPQLVEKINGIVEGASGASQAIAGIAAKNPMMALQGMLKTIGSLFSGEVLSETKKYEGLIGGLSEAFGVLQMKMQRAKGEEKEENFTAQIKNHQERMQQLAHASEAEKRARKTRFWGLFKGRRGGAADWNKVRAFERQREEEYEKLADTYERQREYLTATSQNTIIEKMVLALEKGKEAMKSFEESFDEMVRGTFLRKLKSEFLEKQIQAFFEQYAQATESQGSLDKQEADALRRKGQDILSAAQSRFQKMNKDLQSMGISSGFLGKTKKEGLSGQIRSVTEETAGKLEGILHNVRISQDQAIGLQQRMERHLSGIHSHTAYLKTLSSINQHLSNIDVRLVKTA